MLKMQAYVDLKDIVLRMLKVRLIMYELPMPGTVYQRTSTVHGRGEAGERRRWGEGGCT